MIAAGATSKQPQLHSCLSFFMLQSTALNGRWTPASPRVPTHPTIFLCSEAAPAAAAPGCDISPAARPPAFPAEPPSLPPDAMNLLFGIYSGLWTRRSGCFEGTRCQFGVFHFIGLRSLYPSDIIVFAAGEDGEVQWAGGCLLRWLQFHEETRSLMGPV